MQKIGEEVMSTKRDLEETGNELRDAEGNLISSGEHRKVLHNGNYLCDTCVNCLGLNVRWDLADRMPDHPEESNIKYRNLWEKAKPGEAWLVKFEFEDWKLVGTFDFEGVTYFSVPGGVDFPVKYRRIVEAKRVYPQACAEQKEGRD